MAIILVATPASPVANTYSTLAEANTYHSGHPYASAWDDAADDDTRNRALVTATRLLDERYEWASFAATATQALQWPRLSVLDYLQLTYILTTVIPQKLKDATAELARQVLASNRMADSDVEAQGITSFSAGSVSFAFKDSVSAKVVPDAVRNMIPAWWGKLRGHDIWRPVLRG